ncbi:hypothetical protein HS7_07380 [Sulfolobales archaeon HS-7]|nr:hypothetical protein HS7_07380 [Sulfolobales archaeon HS-7]
MYGFPNMSKCELPAKGTKRNAFDFSKAIQIPLLTLITEDAGKVLSTLLLGNCYQLY